MDITGPLDVGLVDACASTLSFHTLFFHATLSSVALCSASHLASLTSMRMSPVCLLSNITRTVSLICRGLSALLVVILIMCPTHRRRRALIHATMLKVVLSEEASACFVFPVMWNSICVLAPFITLHACSSKIHPSDPYMHTRMLQHAAFGTVIQNTNCMIRCAHSCSTVLSY